MELDERNFGEKLSDSIAKFGGSWWFIILGFTFILTWVILNIFFIVFDEYPFILLNLFLSLIASFQAPFILMTQRRCEIKQDLIYRSLFREIKELVEVDLCLEHEIIQKNFILEEELKNVRKELKIVKKMLSKLIEDKDK